MPKEANAPDPNASPIPDWLVEALKVIFSWALLMPIAVIVSGKLLVERVPKLPGFEGTFFRIPIPGLFMIEAKNDEVFLGFSGFLVTLFIIGVVAGKLTYNLFTYQFGIDPGHFNALCIFCSFATVVWSSLLYVFGKPGPGPMQPVKEEHERLIESLADKRQKDS